MVCRKEWPMNEEREAEQHSIVMGFDALRVCVGQKPRHFTVAQIQKWIQLMNDQPDDIDEGEPLDAKALLRATLEHKVHNHGFVRYVDHMGSDTDIVNAARVSYASESKGAEQDKKLLRYLFEHRHTSPFEMCKVVFHIKMPIFVARQFVRHRMQNMNEVSARYKEMKDEFFIPDLWRVQDTKNKQGSVAGSLPQDYCTEMVQLFYERAYAVYETLLEHGVAREQARIVLPVGLYTEFYTCWDLNNLLKYFALRDDPHAQGEHQDYARAMKEICRTLFPWSMEIYESCKWDLHRDPEPAKS